MLKHDYKDMLGGALLIAAGLFVFFYAITYLPIGSVRRMGPGMFPAITGGLLAGFGAILVVQAFLRQGRWTRVRVWSPFFILGSVVAFALVVGPFGLIPAVMVTTIVASMAELKFAPKETALLAIVVAFISWLIFKLGLGLAIPTFAWPF